MLDTPALMWLVGYATTHNFIQQIARMQLIRQNLLSVMVELSTSWGLGVQAH